MHVQIAIPSSQLRSENNYSLEEVVFQIFEIRAHGRVVMIMWGMER